jgi:hypothetical protein
MSNHLVKILANEDGEKQESPQWHLVQNFGDARRTVCTGEVFGYGEGAAVYKEKFKEKGGITCESCIEIIKWYKSVKL